MYVICATYVGVKVHAWFIQNEIRRRWLEGTGGWIGDCRDTGKNKERPERKGESADRKQISDI